MLSYAIEVIQKGGVRYAECISALRSERLKPFWIALSQNNL